MSVTEEEPKVSTSKAGGSKEKAPLAVAVNTENTQFSAGVLGGVAGERFGFWQALRRTSGTHIVLEAWGGGCSLQQVPGRFDTTVRL